MSCKLYRRDIDFRANREKLILLQNLQFERNFCVKCNKSVYKFENKNSSLNPPPVKVPFLLTIDHIIPRSKGGNNELKNLQILCLQCNEEKADKIEELE